MTDDATDPLTLTVEIDPTLFDEPRRLMWDRLVDEYGQETIADLVKANLSQDLTAQGMQLINALWDNRDQIQVEQQDLDTAGLSDQPGGADE